MVTMLGKSVFIVRAAVVVHSENSFIGKILQYKLT